jgi:hypothetical protein
MLKKVVRNALTVVDEESRKGSRMITRRTFVLEKTYNELYAKRKDLRGVFGEKDTCTTLPKGQDGQAHPSGHASSHQRDDANARP